MFHIFGFNQKRGETENVVRALIRAARLGFPGYLSFFQSRLLAFEKLFLLLGKNFLSFENG